MGMLCVLWKHLIVGKKGIYDFKILLYIMSIYQTQLLFADNLLNAGLQCVRLDCITVQYMRVIK